VTARRCLHIQGAASVPDYDGIEHRSVLAALVGGRNFEALAAGTGAVGRGHGVLTADALLVSAQASPNNTVKVAPGLATVRGTQVNDQGTYLCPLDAVENLTVANKDASSTRNDYVVAQVKDDEQAAFTGDVWELEIVAGTPGSGFPAVPEDCLVLAGLTIAPGTGATVVTSGNITDLRPHARATGGITPVATTAGFPNPQEYDVVWEISTSTFKLRLAGVWVTIGKDLSLNWSSYTPTFTNVTLGTGGKRYGRWLKVGRLVIGEAGFELSSSGEVTGTVQCSLPTPAANPGGGVRYMGAGRAQIGAVFYSCTAIIDPAADVSKIIDYATQGQIWNATNPANWADMGSGGFSVFGHLKCFFNYEAAS